MGTSERGYVGALDGIEIKIRNEDDEQGARKYFYKGFYTMPVKVTVDSRYRFLTMQENY